LTCKLKIALISTYPPTICGIARYTRYLAQALSRIEGVEIYILSEGGRTLEGEAFPVLDTYSRKSPFKSTILRKIDEEKPDVVHFQHDPDLFPRTQELLELFEVIHKRQIQLVVTVHTADTGKNAVIDWGAFYKKTLECGHLIVHNAMSAASVKSYGLPMDNVHVIAHGTAFPPLPSREDARRELGLGQNDFIFLVLGFIHALKNHHTVILGFNKVKNRGRSKLLIAGVAAGGRWYNKLYVAGCRLLGIFNRSIIRHNRFIEDEQIATYLAAADVMLLPYWQKYPSASGIFHLGIGSNLAVICSDSVKFSEVKPCIGAKEKQVFVPMLSPSGWGRAMSNIADSPALNTEIRDLLHAYAKKTSWENIAEEHLDLYTGHLKISSGSTI